MIEYHKIDTVFERDMLGTKKLIEGRFRSEAVQYLANSGWLFTEKIDGTNIRIQQKFGEKEVILFGEGYGVKIQNGGAYRPDVGFILFDVMIGENYQSQETVAEIAQCFGLELVPVVMLGTIQQAVDFVKSKPDSTIGNAKMEGLVGHPLVELKDRCGKRVIVKIKVCDFE